MLQNTHGEIVIGSETLPAGRQGSNLGLSPSDCHATFPAFSGTRNDRLGKKACFIIES